MNGNFEKYLNEMMEMRLKATPTQTPQKAIVNEAEPVQENRQEERGDEVKDKIYEVTNENPPEKHDSNHCPPWAKRIAVCEFLVENAADGNPVKNAQVMLFRSDGCFVRTLTDNDGASGEIPVIADGNWRVSITASGYISVSKAIVVPVAGEKISISVKLDESMSIDGIFAERSGGII